MSDREAFEKWAKDKCHLDSFELNGKKQYAALTANIMWQAWQAAQAQAGDGNAVGYVYHTSGGAREVSWFDSEGFEDDTLLYTKPKSPRAWNHFSLDTMPPPNVPLLVKFKDVIGVYAAMFHVTEPNRDFDFWFSTVSHANANLASPDVYDATNHTCEEWSLLYTAPPAAKVNQQLLEAIEVCASFLSDFGLESSDAYQQALFAIAAAQEQSK